jgi:hypothetical protein
MIDVDELLRLVAERIQLSPSKWQEACERYQTIAALLEGAGSKLRVRDSYPQGSVRIQATIASRRGDDQHDIDFITELEVGRTSPEEMIDLLFHSIDQGEGSRYHGKCTRRNRCVTIEYADMHLDVTPAYRAGEPWRLSSIPDRRLDRQVLSNPEGFALWFAGMLKHAGYKHYELRAYQPAPAQAPVNEKPNPLIVLQLLKRWRNVRYVSRDERKPPSVLLACLIAQTAAKFGQAASLLDELWLHACELEKTFDEHGRSRRLLHVPNPACRQDALTDRWPGSFAAQERFHADLTELVTDLERLHDKARTGSLDHWQEILAKLFGESVTSHAIETMAERFGVASSQGGLRVTPLGGLVLPAALAAPSTRSVVVPQHRFYGTKR